MIFKVSLFQEGLKDPVQIQEFHAKDYKSKNIFEKASKFTKILLSILSAKLKEKPDTYAVQLVLPFFLLFLNLFFCQFKGAIFSLLALTSTVLSFNTRIQKSSRRKILLISFCLLIVALCDSSRLDLRGSYIFPMIYVYKTHELGHQSFGIISSSLILITCLVLSEDLLISLLTFSIILLILSNSQDRPETVSEPHKQDSTETSSSDDSPSPYQSIISSIHHSINNLKKSQQSDSIIETHDSLKKVLKILTKNQNIYSPNLKEITKNLDIEDKIFIEQNTLPSKFEVSNCSPVTPPPHELVYGVSELGGILKQIGKEWNFNTIFVSRITGNFPLYTCGEYIFIYYSFYKLFSIQSSQAKNFLKKVESKYNLNPYHNSCHAADVMNSFLYLSKSIIAQIPSIELFSCILACLGHDIGHPGTNNRFMVQTKHELALHYNDVSVLENMHARDLFSTMNDASCNITQGVGDYWLMRKIIIELILSTDMAKHFDFLASGKNTKLIQDKLLNFNDRLDIYKLTIKSADISHTGKTFEIHKQWCKLLIEEFFSQGDKEKELGLPVSMYCDRKTTDIHKSQSGFLINIALPLFMRLQHDMQSEEIETNCVQQLRKNILYWQKRKDNGRNSTMTLGDGDLLRPEFRRTTLPKLLKLV